MSRLHPLWMIVLLGLSGCLHYGPGETVLSPDDDDDATAGDDDDMTKPVTPADQIETVTFAFSLDGDVRPDPDRDQLQSEIEGTAHILYWRDVDNGDLICRQRADVAMIGGLGDLPALCAGCEGRMRIVEASMQAPDPEDGCGLLPPAVDLGFLVVGGEDAPAPDFRQMDLIPWEELEGSTLTRDGLRPDEVEARYEALGLQTHFLGAVAPTGWLGEAAGLGEVAQPWAEEQLLPMFVLYSNEEDGGDGGNLDGPFYLGSLFRVGVGESLGTTPAQ